NAGPAPSRAETPSTREPQALMPVQPAALTDADLLARLVAFDSTSRNSNLPIADFLCDYLDRPGVRVLRNPSPGGDKVNLIFMLEPNGKPAAGPAAAGPTADGGGHDAGVAGK